MFFLKPKFNIGDLVEVNEQLFDIVGVVMESRVIVDLGCEYCLYRVRWFHKTRGGFFENRNVTERTLKLVSKAEY